MLRTFIAARLFQFRMNKILFLFLLGFVGLVGSKVLSRRRRYVAFPEGSSFSCAGCMTVGVIGQPAPTSSPGIFTFGLNWGIAYELPNVTETVIAYRAKKRPIALRRNRRQLYEKLELIMDNMKSYSLEDAIFKFDSTIFSMGYNGRQCILKTLCETSQRVVPHGSNMIEEIFRTMFTLPMAKVLSTEPLEHTIYDSAHRLGKLLDSCENFKCPLSLVDLAKGYYNAPAPTVDTAKTPWSLFSSSFNTQ